MIRPPPESTRPDPLFPYPTLFRSDGLVRVGRDQRVIGATYITDRRQMALTDPRLSEMAQSLSKALGGRSVYFIDASADEAHWLLWAGTDTDPGRYYRYTPGLKQLRSEERRVGKGCVSTCRSRGSTDH